MDALATIARIVAAANDDDVDIASRVSGVAIIGRAWLDENAGAAREALASAIQRAEKVGSPPVITRAIGWPDAEKPQNRLLGWILDPTGDHGAGTAPLEEFAAYVGLHALAREPVEVRREIAWPSDAGSNRAPDLLFLGEREALVVENKVGAPESGDGQYRDYLEAIRTLVAARGIGSWRIVLSARQHRRLPHEWTDERSARVVTHDDMAAAIERAAARRSGWARVSCLLAARQLRGGASVAECLPEARALLSRQRPGSVDIARMLILSDVLSSAADPFLE